MGKTSQYYSPDFPTGNTLFLLLLTIFCLSCEKEVKWKLSEVPFQTVVVDGLLTNEFKTQSIRLSLVNQQINQPQQSLSGAMVSVNDGTSAYTFTESVQSPGTYVSEIFQAVAGKTYTLQIEVQGTIYEASASMVGLTPAGAISWTYNNEKSLYQYQAATTGNPTMTEVNLNWSENTVYTNIYGSDRARMYFYVLDNIDANEIFAPDKEIIYFPAGTKIVRRQYSLSAAHQEFLRSLLMETEWKGGIFDVLPANVKSNISNGGLGFFGVCMTQVDSTIVK